MDRLTRDLLEIRLRMQNQIIREIDKHPNLNIDVIRRLRDETIKEMEGYSREYVCLTGDEDD